MKAKFINLTAVAGREKIRWECPKCRADPKQPECRFNLIKGKKIHKCRFCGIKLSLIMEDGK